MSKAKGVLVLALFVLALLIQPPIGPTRIPVPDESIVDLPPLPVPFQYALIAFLVGLGIALASIVAFMGARRE